MNPGEVKYFNHSSKPKCVFVENKELPLICIDFWFKAGSAFEESDRDGTAHFLEHMISVSYTHLTLPTNREV